MWNKQKWHFGTTRQSWVWKFTLAVRTHSTKCWELCLFSFKWDIWYFCVFGRQSVFWTINYKYSGPKRHRNKKRLLKMYFVWFIKTFNRSAHEAKRHTSEYHLKRCLRKSTDLNKHFLSIVCSRPCHCFFLPERFCWRGDHRPEYISLPFPSSNLIMLFVVS